jgi:hypothetical protein
VTVRESCTLIKFVLHQCYINDMNLFSQVRFIGNECAWRFVVNCVLGMR